MDRNLYDDDIYAWSEQQAAALRLLAERPARLPNELDLVHVAEEIEDLGKSQRDAAESYLRLILVHLIKLTATPQAPPARHWRSEIVTFQIELLARLTPAMRDRIDLDRIWLMAKRQARANLDESEEQAFDHPLWDWAACPVGLDSLADEDFDVDQTLVAFAPRS